MPRCIRCGRESDYLCNDVCEDCERYNQDAESDGHLPVFNQREFDDYDLDDDRDGDDLGDDLDDDGVGIFETPEDAAVCHDVDDAQPENPISQPSGDNLLFSTRQISKTIKNQLAISDLKDGVIWFIHENPLIAIKVIGDKLTVHKQENK